MAESYTPKASGRRARRLVAVAMALALGFGGSVLASTPAGAAVSVGSIRGTSPLTSITLDSHSYQQVVNSSVSTSRAFYKDADYVFVGGTLVDFPVGQQSFGGTGTRLDPYFLQTASTGVPPAGVTRTTRISYVNGDTFYKADVTLLNNNSTARPVDIYRYADCLLAGSDEGYSTTPTTSAQCNRSGVGLALIPLTPGYSLQSGFYWPVRLRAEGNQGLTNQCLSDVGRVLTDAQCRTTSQDNGFAVAWESQLLQPGVPVTFSYLTNYAATAPTFADLDPSTTVSTSSISVGDTITYTLSVTNGGPDGASNTSVVAARPSQFTYVSSTGDGNYDPVTGTWAVGNLSVGASASLTITARAATPGNAQFGVLAANSNSVDLTACTVGSATNCGPQPAVLVQEISAAASSFTVSTGTRVADGTEFHTVTTTLRTAGGVPVRGQENGLVVASSPDTGVTVGPFEETGTPGVYSAPLSSTRMGSAAVSVTAPVGGAPAVIPVASGGNANAVFTAGPPAVGTSTVTIDDALSRVADNDQYHVVTVVLEDASGNPVESQPSLIESSAPTGVTVSTFTQTATAGTYSALVRSTVAGAHTISVGVAAGTIGSVVANFVAGDVDLESPGTVITLVTSGTRTVADPATVSPTDPTHLHVVRATLVDANGNPIVGRDVVFDLPPNVQTVSGGELTVATDESGVAEVRISTETAGSYPITASVDGGTLVNGSPVTAVFVPDTPAFGAGATVLDATDGTVEANGVATHTVTVTVRDQFGNAAPTVPVTLNLPEGLDLAPGSAASGISDPQGLFTAVVTSTLAGSYNVTATVAGSPVVTGSPASVLFAAGAPSASQSAFTVTPASPIAVGSQYTGAVIIRDATGNPVAGAAASFTVPDGLSIVEAGPYLSDDSGQVEVHFSAELAGTYIVTAGVGGDTVSTPVSMGFVAGSPDVGNTETTLARTSEALVAVADGNDLHEVTATIVDQFGNPVLGQPVTFAVPAGTSVAGGGSPVVSTDAAGQAVIELVSTAAGVYTITASIDDDPIANGSPVSLTFVAGQLSQANSTLTLTPEGPLVVGSGASSTYTAVIHTADAFNNPVRGIQVTLESTPLLTQSATGGVTDTNGDLTITLTSTRAGIFAITATAQATQFGGLPDTQVREYVAAAPDLDADGQSTLGVTVGARTADGSDTHTLTATIRDVFGNPVPGQDVAFALPSGVTSTGGTVVATDEIGVATLAVTSVVAGTYEISAYAASTAGSPAALIANGDPASLLFIAGPAAPSLSTLVVTPGATPPLPVGTDTDSTYTAVASVRDANGNPVPGVEVAFALAGSPAPTDGQPALSAESQLSGENGTVSVTVTSTLAGDFTLDALIGGDTLPGSAAPVAWVPGPADAVNSQLVLSAGSHIADGIDAHTATITARDRFGNVLIDPVSFDLAVQAPAIGSGMISTNATGQVAAPIVSTVSGEFEISATLAGVTIPGAGTVMFGSSTASPDQSTIDADPTVLPADGVSTSTITVQLRDVNKNPLTESGGTVTMMTTAGTLGAVADNDDGTYTATYTSPTSVGSGSTTISFTVDDSASDKTTEVTLIPGAASATTSTITAAPASIAADGVATSTITTTLTDANGNPLTSSGGTVTMATTAGTLGPVSDNGDGTYTSTLTSSIVADAATVSFTLNSVAGANTATVTFTPGTAAAAASTIAASPASITADGATTSTITVTLADANGNPLTSSGGTVTMAATAGSLGPVTDNGDGTYTSSLTSPTVAGIASVTFTVNGDTSSNTTTVTFTAGAADPAASSIAATPVSITADGSSTAAITVTLRDSSGNQLTDGGDEVTMTSTAGTVGAVTDNGDGTYTAALTSSTVAATATISFTVNSGEGTNTAAVTFTPGVASPGASTIFADPTAIVANGADTSTITVTLKDPNDNPLTSSGGTVTISTTSGILGPVTDNADGTYTATLTSPVTAGSGTLSFTVEGEASPNTETVLFETGDSDAASSTIGADQTSLIADGSTSTAITVTARDVNGNQVPFGGSTVTMSTTGGALGPITDNGDGTYTATLTSPTAAGIGTVSFTLDGAPAEQTVTVTFTPGVASPARSTIVADPATITADGVASSSVIVELIDSFDNPITGGGDDVVLSTTGGTLTAVSSNGDGTYTATLTSPITVGSTTITFTVNGAPATARATVQFTPGPLSAATSTIGSSPDSLVAGSGATSAVTVTGLDANGNLVRTGGGDVTISTSAGSISAVTDNGDGTYTATLTAGTTVTTATIGFTIAGTEGTATATVDFITGPPDAANSTIAASPTTLEADGTSTSTITVTVRDAVGNPIPGEVPTLTTTRGTLASLTDNGDGTYTATLTSTTTPGTAIIGFTLQGVTSPTTATVVMEDTTAPESPVITSPTPGSTASPTTEFTGTAEPGTTVTIRNENGDPVCTAVASETAAWSCTPTTPLPLGPQAFTAQATDASGNTSELSILLDIVVVGDLALTIDNTVVLQGASTTVVGRGFLPGETVSGIVRSDPLDLGLIVAGADGTATFTIQIPADFDLGDHTVILTGVTSGSVSGTITVMAPANAQPPSLGHTGSTTPSSLLLGAVLAGVAGAVLIGFARRQKKATAATPPTDES